MHTVYFFKPRGCTCKLFIFLSLEAVHVCIFLSLSLEAVTCMCTYLSILFSKPWTVMLVFYWSLDTGCVGRVG